MTPFVSLVSDGRHVLVVDYTSPEAPSFPLLWKRVSAEKQPSLFERLVVKLRAGARG